MVRADSNIKTRSGRLKLPNRIWMITRLSSNSIEYLNKGMVFLGVQCVIDPWNNHQTSRLLGINQFKIPTFEEW